MKQFYPTQKFYNITPLSKNVFFEYELEFELKLELEKDFDFEL